MKATLELTDEQLLDVVQFVKSKGITAVFEGALLLEVGKKYRNRKGEEVLIEGEEYGQFRSGNHLYFANGRYLEYESDFDLIEEVEEELPFEMVVGGVYKDRKGRVEKIVEEYDSSIFPFKGESGRIYTETGDSYSFKETSYDLIKRIR